MRRHHQMNRTNTDLESSKSPKHRLSLKVRAYAPVHQGAIPKQTETNGEAVPISQSEDCSVERGLHSS